ncbi:hypothetical protein EJ02DRAFT_464323 [Clathrospora elynae]|uniref:Uncharacterized protein n=1 Tax=Clathrospora elynae TaxID=706981 RepID=A0A6A5SUR2_9PLEO|nr:hypothetical protein EJ02DRAFT_464323 [Clathrospora elynae]
MLPSTWICPPHSNKHTWSEDEGKQQNKRMKSAERASAGHVYEKHYCGVCNEGDMKKHYKYPKRFTDHIHNHSRIFMTSDGGGYECRFCCCDVFGSSNGSFAAIDGPKGLARHLWNQHSLDLTTLKWHTHSVDCFNSSNLEAIRAPLLSETNQDCTEAPMDNIDTQHPEKNRIGADNDAIMHFFNGYTEATITTNPSDLEAIQAPLLAETNQGSTEAPMDDFEFGLSPIMPPKRGSGEKRDEKRRKAMVCLTMSFLFPCLAAYAGTGADPVSPMMVG